MRIEIHVGHNIIRAHKCAYAHLKWNDTNGGREHHEIEWIVECGPVSEVGGRGGGDVERVFEAVSIVTRPTIFNMGMREQQHQVVCCLIFNTFAFIFGHAQCEWRRMARRHSPITITMVILTVLIFARGIMPRELARRQSRSSPLCLSAVQKSACVG